VVVFAEEVARRFGLNDQAPSYDENWIADRSIDLIVAMAA